MYLNKAYLIGNVTRDPELRALPSGSQVCSFSLATNYTYKDKNGQRQESTDFHNVVAFGKLGELSAQYLRKGSQTLVEGRIQTRSWEDKTDGQKKYRTEIVADNIQFGSRPQGGAAATPNTEPAAGAAGAASPKASAEKDTSPSINYPEEEINPDDIPF